MKLFSINKGQAAVLTTLLILIFLGAAYFFVYLPHNERRIQEQRFSALQNIDRNIHTKIENSVALLNNLLSRYQTGNEKRRKELIRYIEGYSSTNFSLTIPDTISQLRRRLLKDSLSMDSAYTIRVNNDTREISLVFFKQQIREKLDTTVYKIAMKFSFQQFIRVLLPRDVFDDYIVFSKGKPVYESFPAGISYVKEDSLLGSKNGFGSSGIRSQVISGRDYKMFLQPVGFDARNEWVIGGLMTQNHYENEKTQLPTQFILLLSTILLICLIAFPWLKLYQMGSKDRLTITDGIASIFISMLLVSLIFFVFFNYNHQFRPPANKDSKTSLANGIYNAFKTETDTVYQKLEQFDKMVTLPGRDIVNVDNGAIAYADAIGPVQNAAGISEQAKGIDIHQVFWLNKNGDEVINWTADYINAPHGNFKSRGYFKNIVGHQDYLIDSVGDRRFFLEQVISWTSGAFRSVISIKSKLSQPDSIVVAALSFNFKSLDKVVLPAGYLFAITDNAGNVLYHSDASRNLNENLPDVFSNSNQLKSCLDAKVQGNFTTKYFGKEYAIEVKPLKRLPYFIIVFEDTSYNETSDMEIYSFTFAMLFFIFAFLVLQLFGIFLVSAKRSFFKKQLLNTSWIGPKISSHHEYILSAVFNFIIIFLLVLFFDNSSFLQYLFMLLLSVTAIPLFLNGIFEKRYLGEKRNIFQFKALVKYCLWAFDGIILVVAFKLLSLPHFFGVLGYQILLVLLGIGLYLLRQPVYNVAYQLKASKNYKVLLGKWNYVNSFALMVLTRLVITSGLPVLFFFISSYNYEQNLSIRYKQFDFAQRLVNKFPGMPPGDIFNPNNKWNGVYFDSSFISNISVVTRRQALTDNRRKPYSDEEATAISLLKLFRLGLTDKAIIEEKFYTTGAIDSSFHFNHLLREACNGGQGTTTYLQSSTPGQYLQLQSENLNYHYPSIFNEKKFNGAVFWLLLIVTLLVFYFIVGNIIRKLFSLNLPDLELWKKLDNEILINKYWDQPLFVIGLPGAGKKKYLLDKISNGEIALEDGTPLYYDNVEPAKNNVFIAELINIPSSGNEAEEKAIWNEYTKKVFDGNNRVIIVNHFEYNIQDPVSNRFKLEFLERLYLENKCKIVILSTIHPVAFLDSAMDFSYKPDEKSQPGQDLERWHVLLGHYLIVVLHLQLRSLPPTTHGHLHGSIVRQNNGSGIPDAAVIIKGTPIKKFTEQDGQFNLPGHPLPFTLIVLLEGYQVKEVAVNSSSDLAQIELAEGDSFISAGLLRQETNPTYFLKKTQASAFEAGRALSEQTRIDKFDELAFKLQVSSHYFYMYIWQSLTKEEKFLLYDLAEDNLVNSFDDYNLSMLIAKGVIIRPDGTLKLFNRGFRNFILTAIGNQEAIKIKNQIKDNGNWNTLKSPLQLVIVAILAFLLTSQEEAFAKLITYVAALGAGVPAVLKLFTLFDKSSQKPS